MKKRPDAIASVSRERGVLFMEAMKNRFLPDAHSREGLACVG